MGGDEIPPCHINISCAVTTSSRIRRGGFVENIVCGKDDYTACEGIIKLSVGFCPALLCHRCRISNFNDRSHCIRNKHECLSRIDVLNGTVQSGIAADCLSFSKGHTIIMDDYKE